MLTSKQDYPSDVFEAPYLVKLFHNKELQDKYLMQTLPSIFLDIKKRVIVYLMRKLYEADLNITVDNIISIQAKLKDDAQFRAFLRKHYAKPLSYDDIYDIVHDVSVSSETTFFDDIRKEMLSRSFSRFVTDILSDIEYNKSFWTDSHNFDIIVKMKGAIKLYDILQGRKKNNIDYFQETMDLVNGLDEYIPTSSRTLNGYIGGFTRNYPAIIAAKSSHCKSSWADYNILSNILSGAVSKVTKITPEETASTQLRRYVAMLCKISTTDMRLKLAKITDEHIKILKEKIGGKLEIIHSAVKLSDVIDAMNNSKADMIYIDHINGIDYPGRGTFLERMVGNIPELVNAEKRIAMEKHISIVNISQVNDKDIQRSTRIVKAPRFWDVYGSSALYHASREFLTLWYPYKDQEDNDLVYEESYDMSDIRILIEKSSFSKVGRIKLNFIPEYNLFYDIKREETKMEKEQVWSPPETGDLFG